VEIIKYKKGWYDDVNDNKYNNNKMTTAMTTTNRMISNGGR
jgi:hypothetical protein